MRSSIILTSLLAALALANPVDKRALTTKIEIYTVYTTVTRGAEPTGLDNAAGRGRGRGRHRSSSTVAEVSAVEPSAAEASVESTSIEVVVPTPEADPSSSEEAQSSSETPIVSSSEEPVPSSDPAPIPVTPDTNEEVGASAPEPAASAPEPAAPAPEPAAPAPEPAAPAPEPAAPAPEPSAPAAPSPEPVSQAASSSWAQQILDQHNIHRANHTDTGPLTWSDELAATALRTANSCVYEHDTETDSGQYDSGYGQNIGAGYPPEAIPGMITNSMYNDEAPLYEGLYGQDSPDMSNFHEWGHFSQIVWRNTREVGCATVECGTLQNARGMSFFTVCNYAPPGNFGGEYSNVGTRLGRATVSI